MTNLLHWQKWPLAFKLLAAVVTAALLGLMGLTAWSWWQGYNLLSHWLLSPSLEAEVLPLDNYQLGLFTLEVPTEVYFILQRFVPTLLELNYWPLLVFAFALALGWSLILAALPRLPFIPFAVGAAMFIIFLQNMGLDGLGIWPALHNKVFMGVVLAIFLLPLYLFRDFAKKVNAFTRALFFLVLFAALFTYINFAAQPVFPLAEVLHLTLAIPIVLVLLLFVFNAHEMVRSLAALANGPGSNGVIHFIVLNLLYLSTLVFYYLLLNNKIKTDFQLVHPLIWSGFITLLALYRLPMRTSLFKNIDFYPTGLLLYLGMSTLAWGAIFYSAASVNDPLKQIYEDISLYTQLAFGLPFFLYIIANFGQLLAEGIQFGRVIYKGKFVSYSSAWVSGILIFMIFIFNDNFLQFDKSFAAWYNQQGDTELLREDAFLANQNYNLALGYSPYNHRSHYALGSIQQAQKDNNFAFIYFKDGSFIWPTEFSYVHAANANLPQDRKLLENILLLQQGFYRLPGQAPHIANNLGLLYQKLNLTDSVAYYLRQASSQGDALVKETARVNGLASATAVAGNSALVTEADLYQLTTASEASNLLARWLKNGERHTGIRLQPELLPADSVLNTPQMAYLYHLTLHHPTDEQVMHSVNAYANHPENSSFSPFLYAALADLLIQKGDGAKAMRLYKAVAERSASTDPNSYMRYGVRLMQYQQYTDAASAFSQAMRRGNNQAVLYQAIAEMEAGLFEKAASTWALLTKVGDKNEQALAAKMIKLTSSPQTADQTDQQLLVQKLRYFPQLFTPTAFAEAVSSIESERVKALVLQQRLMQGNNGRISAVETADLYDRLITAETNEAFQAQMQASFMEFELQNAPLSVELDSAIQHIAYTDLRIESQKQQYLAQKALLQSDTVSAAEHLQSALQLNPYAAEAYIQLTDIQAPEQAYNTLLTALEWLPLNLPLLKKYIYATAAMGVPNFGEAMLPNVKLAASPAEYSVFVKNFREEVAKAEAEQGF